MRTIFASSCRTRWNAGLYWEVSRQHWSIHLLPDFELTFIPRTRSFHVEIRFLVLEFVLNTFWRRR